MADSLPAPQRPEALFPRLPRGRLAPPPRRVARHQRSRLMGAMVESVARHGYAGTTVAELAALAGVSKSAFYERFASKEECFLTTFEEIVGQAVARVGHAYRSREGLRDQLRAGLDALAELGAAEPAAARLVVVDSLSLGQAALGPRERAAARFERLFAQSFAQAPEEGEVSELEIRAIVNGIRMVLFRCLREGEAERLGEHAGDLIDWAISYQRPAGSHAVAPEFFTDDRAPAAGATASEELDWREPPNSKRSRKLLSQRHRIVRAAALVAAERGYAALSIPAISARAGTSNQTFYENFADKHQAFLEAFDTLGARMFADVKQALSSREEWPEAVGAAAQALLSFVAANPVFARVAFVELPASGPDGLDHAARAMADYTELIGPAALPDGVEPVPGVVMEAIGGGAWGVMRHEVHAGREASLPRLAAQLTDVALVPFGFPRLADRAVRGA